MSGATRLLLWAACLCVASLVSSIAAQPTGRSFYASPIGLATNPGTQAQPLDLAKALSATSPLQPGDTLWLLGGTYTGSYVSDIKGTPSSPIIIRQAPGERVIFDNNPSKSDIFWLNGGYVWLWGFEVMSSEPTRQTDDPGSFPVDLKRGNGVQVLGPGTKIIHLVLHDLAGGVGSWSTASGSEIYGNIVSNNGWESSDRSHGHNIYIQNRGVAQVVKDNIIFNAFNTGIHAYGSDQAVLENITLDGNTIFNSTILWSIQPPQRGSNILFGGGVVSVNPRVTDNVSYQPFQTGGLNYLGYQTGCGSSLTMTGNYFTGGYPVIFTNCTGTVTGNFFAGLIQNGSYLASYPNNTWVPESALPLKGLRTFVRPSPYEPGRANITVFNWDKTSTVSVDVSASGLKPGETFEVRDAQNFYGPVVMTGTYASTPITIPMTGLTAVRPIGSVKVIPPHTAPEFAVFVLRPTASAVRSPAAPTVMRVVQ